MQAEAVSLNFALMALLAVLGMAVAMRLPGGRETAEEIPAATVEQAPLLESL